MTIRSAKMKTNFIIFIMLLLVLAFYVIALHAVFTSRFPGANDFYSRWRAAQVFWQDGLNPYSAEATLAIQTGIYGRPAGPNEDPGLFAYPFYTVFFLIPIVPLDYAWASAIWLTVIQVSLIAAALLTLAIYCWQQPPWLLGLTILWSLLFYHSARTIFLGQFAGVVYFFIVLCLWSLHNQHDTWAGIVLALTTLKPQMAFLLIPALLLWALFNRRWRFTIASAAAMGLLLLLSFALQPTWLADFLEQLAQYPSYTAIGSPIWVVTHYYLPFLGRPVEIVLSLLAVGWLLYAWWYGFRPNQSLGAFYWAMGVTLVVTNLVALRTATTNYVMMYPVLFLGLKLLAARVRYGKRWVALFYAVSFLGLWALFFLTVDGQFEHPIIYLPLPLALTALLLLARPALEETAVTPLEQRR